MTGPGGDYGEQYRAQPGPWPQHQHPPVDPREPLNYPDYPYPGPPPGPQQPPPYGYVPPPYGGPVGYGPPMYPGPYDPYQPYPSQTNGLAVASLVTSIAGVVLGIPLAIFCYIGWVIPVVGAVLGGIALGQIKRSGQQGRGMAIAGVAIGSATAALLVLIMVIVTAAALHSPTVIR
ncbi:DUF4190 domain-containing protein [Mycobacterium sp.]|uniref:DUF4190 domain-containing protein n=1 Tax=Mycobacterium sp. TaxID=1785 RepID=UPI0031D1BC03